MWTKIFKHQQWHILIMIILLSVIYYFIEIDVNILNGELWGVSTFYWLIFAILAPIIHQIYVLVFWRIELYIKGITKSFGRNAFKLYKVGFALLILSRLISILLLAISNAKSFEMNSIIIYIISGILFLPSIYLFYSVYKYFGMDRAFGIDHFYPEKFKNETFVKKGIFKYTSNGMYVFGFFVLWIPGVLLQSEAALLIALFNHIYIWVHYYFTELPDMNEIYKDNK